MHTQIKILVYATSRTEGRKETERVAKVLKETLIFDEVTVGSGFRADSKRGASLIEEGMSRNEERFRRNLKRVRGILTRNSSDALYVNEHDLDNDIRYWAWQLNNEHEYFIFDDDGEAIHTPAHLQNVLEGWPSLDVRPAANEEVFVFTAVTHY